jgi:hypothetical protein
MAKRWRRVATDTDIMDLGGTTIIRITRGKKGDLMAGVERMNWFEPDGHEYTGYADAVTDPRRPAAEVLPEFDTKTAVVTLESEDLWDEAWGELITGRV